MPSAILINVQKNNFFLKAAKAIYPVYHYIIMVCSQKILYLVYPEKNGNGQKWQNIRLVLIECV
jgi:hypothetical protein